MNLPNATYTLDAHRYLYEDQEVEVLYEHFHEDSRDGLQGEITIKTGREPRPGLLHNGRISLSSAPSRANVVKALEKRRQSGFLEDVDFDGIILQTAYLSQRRWRQGEPAIQLKDHEPSARPKWLIYPFLQEQAVCVLFGDGGSGKTTLADALGLSVVTGIPFLGSAPTYTGNVLFLDWETEADSHYELVKALCNGNGTHAPEGFWYRRMYAPFASSIAAVRQEVAAHEVKLLIIDSVGMAGGDDPEKASTKIALYTALRTLSGVTTLAVDHVSTTDKNKPYGSVYARNIPRVVWAISKAEDDDQEILRVGLRLNKLNRGRAIPRKAFSIHYTMNGEDLESVQIQNLDPLSVEEFKKKAPIVAQISHELKSGAKDTKALADILDKSEAVIKATISRKQNRGRFQLLPGGLWGNAVEEHRES